MKRLVAATVLLAALAVASPVAAATISIDGTAIVIASGPAADDFFSYTDPEQGHVFEPDGAVPLAAGDGCGVDVATVVCPVEGVTSVTFTGGEGNDVASFDGLAGLTVAATGDAGDDSLSGSPLGDDLSGGGGSDYIDGQGGPDHVDGGDDDDTIEAGLGFAGETVIGGPGPYDSLNLSGATGGAVITLDDVANDSVGGDTGANVHADVESVFGSAHADTLTGSGADNILDGKGGNDVLFGGEGFDILLGADGDDRLDVADLIGEHADCGVGTDTAVLDGADTVAGCEVIEYRATDADGDGSRVPADCDDANGSIRPGAPEVPGDGIDQDCSGADRPAADNDGDGATEVTDCDDNDSARAPGKADVPQNGIDENCDGADAPYPASTALIRFLTSVTGARTRVTTFTVSNLPKGGRVVVRCKRRGCPFAKRTIKATGKQLKLTRLFRGARLRPRARVEIRVVEQGKISPVRVDRVRRGKPPRVTGLCLFPNRAKPRACG
jgi:hypothetical protein